MYLLLVLQVNLLYALTRKEQQAALSKAEEIIGQLVTEVETIYAENRCTTSCQNKSFHACTNVQPIPTCSNRYPDKINCPTSNLSLVSFEASLIKPAQVDGVQLPLASQENRSICGLTALDKTFQNISATNEFILRQLICTKDGIYRGFPYHRICGDYDCRDRPWYKIGLTGANNVIFVLDQSGSMNQTYMGKSKISYAVEAITASLLNLNYYDQFGFVAFSNQTWSYSQTLEQAGGEDVIALTKQLRKLIAGSYSNYEAGFRAAFDILEQTWYRDGGIGNSNIIIFMTDGPISLGLGAYGYNVDQLYEYINTTAAIYDAKIFTYSLGDYPAIEVPRAIACQNGGIWQQIQNLSMLQDSLSLFHSVLSEGGTRVIKPKWVQPYEDAGGAGLVISGSQPFYYLENGTYVMIGVVSLDIKYSYLSSVQNDTNLQALLLSNSRQGTLLTFQECLLEYYRYLPIQRCNKSEVCFRSQPSTCNESFVADEIYYAQTEIIYDANVGVQHCCYSEPKDIFFSEEEEETSTSSNTSEEVQSSAEEEEGLITDNNFTGQSILRVCLIILILNMML